MDNLIELLIIIILLNSRRMADHLFPQEERRLPNQFEARRQWYSQCPRNPIHQRHDAGRGPQIDGSVLPTLCQSHGYEWNPGPALDSDWTSGVPLHRSLYHVKRSPDYLQPVRSLTAWTKAEHYQGVYQSFVAHRSHPGRSHSVLHIHTATARKRSPVESGGDPPRHNMQVVLVAQSIVHS